MAVSAKTLASVKLCFTPIGHGYCSTVSVDVGSNPVPIIISTR